jgi:formylglycine-generating enzyme required for sulfatase activity
MAQTRKVSDFFVAGGTLRPDASSYVQRPADNELFEHALAGEFCYVLTSRQMGKSSLMIRTEQRLREHNVKTVIIDLTNIGTDINIEQWYLGLLSRVQRRLRLNIDLETWWGEHAAFSYLQRFTDFLREVVMTEVSERVVIFVDEIDSTLSLDFRDDFFAGIRAFYNARAEDQNLERLTFVLLGVAAPTELISDRSRTPFNIGHEISLQEFSYQDAAVLQAELESGFPGQGESIFKRIYHWTNGHPYLTQRLCLAVSESQDGQWDEQGLDALVTKLFLTEEARKETNLKYVQDRILANQRKIDLLHLYRKVLRGKQVEDDGQSLLQNQLKLSGLIKVDKGKLSIRNQIYRRAFNDGWIKENLPKVTPQRIAVVASLLAVIAIAIVVYLVLESQGQEADVQAQTYIQQFENSQSSDVRLVSLAGLIDLGEPYSQDAYRLFMGMNDDEQIALFRNISAPDDFSYEVFLIVNKVYQDMPNTLQGNQKLDVMADILGDPNLKTEIELWLQARSLVDEEQFRAALSVYDTAWRMSEEREHLNLSILFEKGEVASHIGANEQALAAFETVLAMDETSQEPIEERIARNPELFEFWFESKSQFDTLIRIVPKIRDDMGIPMSLIPAGAFEMGQNSDETFAECQKTREPCNQGEFRIEEPIHPVTLENYYMDQFEVTNRWYQNCVEDGVCSPPSTTESETRKDYFGNPEFDNFPVLFVNWHDAVTFCEWRGARLPTEAEWEKAARGGLVGRMYPWGDDRPGCDFGSLSGAQHGFCEPDTVQVGSFAANNYGIYDMSGNVTEWLSDWFRDNYYESSPDFNPPGPEVGDERAVRGGAWPFHWFDIRTAGRGSRNPEHRDNELGFRCVRNLIP